MKKFYPNIRNAQIKVGIFTLVIVIVLLLGYMWLTNRVSTRSLQDLSISFEDVAGLEVGDKVMYRGMELGRIRSIENKDERVLVKARIHKEIRLREGSAFHIGDSSLMGGTALSIVPGSGPGWLSMTNVFSGEAPSGMMSIVSRASETMDELKLIMAELRKESGVIDKSASLLDDAGTAVRNVDSIASGLGKDFGLTLKRLDTLTAQIDALVEANSDSLNKSISSAPAAIAGLHGTLDSLRTLSGQLNIAASKLNSGTGTAGRLMSDAELYNRLLESVNNLDALVTDVKANPKKYVKFSLF